MRARARAWVVYAATGLVLTAGLAAAGAAVMGGAEGRAVVAGAVVAYLLQLAAFALLLGMRDRAQLFLAGWLGGMVLRFGVLGLGAFWLSRTAWLPTGPALVSYVTLVFLLVLLEPVFLRWDLRES